VNTVPNSTFTKFTDPYISDVGVTSPFSPDGGGGSSYFDWNGALDGLSENEFALLMRTVELVVQAQTFSRERLQQALRISQDSAVTMTRSIELLGIISAGEPNAQRRVLVSVRTLPVLLAKMLSGRDHLPSFASPEELRIAS
jgi:DNA segregation ATPase FtsK/SpoIIIE-like protein